MADCRGRSAAGLGHYARPLCRCHPGVRNPLASHSHRTWNRTGSLVPAGTSAPCAPCAPFKLASAASGSNASGAALRLSNLSVTLDSGKAVVKDAEVDIAQGERVLVAGESGTGKSTLVRAIVGLWPWARARFRSPAERKCFNATTGLRSRWLPEKGRHLPEAAE